MRQEFEHLKSTDEIIINDLNQRLENTVLENKGLELALKNRDKGLR